MTTDGGVGPVAEEPNTEPPVPGNARDHGTASAKVELEMGSSEMRRNQFSYD